MQQGPLSNIWSKLMTTLSHLSIALITSVSVLSACVPYVLCVCVQVTNEQLQQALQEQQEEVRQLQHKCYEQDTLLLQQQEEVVAQPGEQHPQHNQQQQDGAAAAAAAAGHQQQHTNTQGMNQQQQQQPEHGVLVDQQGLNPPALQLPVSLPAHSDATHTPGVAADTHKPHSMAAAGPGSAHPAAAAAAVLGPDSSPAAAAAAAYSPPPSAHSYVGSTTGGGVNGGGVSGGSPAPQWEDIVSTASSSKSSRGWFGVFGGRRQQRSALV